MINFDTFLTEAITVFIIAAIGLGLWSQKHLVLKLAGCLFCLYALVQTIQSPSLLAVIAVVAVLYLAFLAIKAALKRRKGKKCDRCGHDEHRRSECSNRWCSC